MVLYVLLKLKLIKGKALIFVNNVERGYRVKLFLEQFGIKACVLNAELPLNSRYHIVEEFNKGIYDYIIATDEMVMDEEFAGEEKGKGKGKGKKSIKQDEVDESKLIASAPAVDEAEEEAVDAEEEEVVEDQSGDATMEDGNMVPVPEAGPSTSTQKRKAPDTPAETTTTTQPPKKKGRKEDKSYGVSRGIDFVAVACLINFDLPTTASAYTHRIGRTARAGHSGLALSFVVPKSSWGKDRNVSLETAKYDEKAFERIRKEIKEEMVSDINEWDFGGRKGEMEGFRYRMEDALKAVTPKRVQEARREELRRELLNSEKLKVRFSLLLLNPHLG